MRIRELEIAVISDLHLATHACRPKKVLKYLKTIHPKKLVLNGDIIDAWRFSRNYFPKTHLKIIRQLIKMMETGVELIYITGNHDEFLRKFSQAEIGNLKIVNQHILDLNGNKTWIFHGDIFDDIIHESKWLAKLGAAVYGILTIINQAINLPLHFFGKKEIIIYKSLKKYLVKEKLNLSRFEKAIGNASASHGYNTVICGHTHFPKNKILNINENYIHYLNCGDWIEHFTAAEYYNNKWHLYYHNGIEDDTPTDDLEIPKDRQLYQSLIKELAYTNIL